jgi:hypothetical protein
LVSPVYFGHNVIWHIPPDQKTTVKAVTKIIFGKNTAKREFASVLLYRLQKKKRLEFNDQSNTNNTFTEDSSTSLQLLVIWKSNDECSFSVRALLIKHSNTIVWNEDTLWKLYSMHTAPLKKYYCDIKDTWLLDDATVLMTTSKWKNDSYVFEITISEGTRKDIIMEPIWVSSSM